MDKAYVLSAAIGYLALFGVWKASTPLNIFVKLTLLGLGIWGIVVRFGNF
jgi:hypothetical protein